MASLTVRAVAQGAIDLRQARPRDPAWRRRFYVLLTEFGRREEERLLAYALQFQLALLSNPSLEQSSWEAAHKNASACYDDLVEVLAPWARQAMEKRKQEQGEHYQKLYKRLIGDYWNDPKFRARIHEEARKLSERKPPRFSPEELQQQTRARLVAEYRSKKNTGPRYAARRPR